MAEPRRNPHLLRVEDGPQAFAPLLAAATAAGARVGWLELAAIAHLDEPSLPEPLASVLAAGGERAVVIGATFSLSARRRKGSPVLRDVLRQQFLGCALVLARGDVEAPLLRAG